MGKLSNLLARTIVVIGGLVVVSIGVSILLCCNLGTDPVTVFNDGLSSSINTTFGTAQIITSLFVLILVVIIKKSYINIATILSAFILGPMIDIASSVVSQFISNEIPLLIRIGMCFVAVVILSVGVALYISPSLGIGATDIIPEILSELLHIQYRYVRVTVDIMFFVSGYFLGGVIGIGTVIAAVCTGPLIQLFKPYANRFTIFFVNLVDRQLQKP
ncbi:MAG: DUF6198 family protein [Oscillospiraceae bacterium]